MKVAVPLFGEDVSPRFGCSAHILIATIDESGIHAEGIRDITGLATWQLPEFLASLDVTKVICGGMHWRFQEEMQRRGIDVIWGVIGPAADALAALQSGSLQKDQFLCRGRFGPGGWGRGRQGQGQGRVQQGGRGHGPGKGQGARGQGRGSGGGGRGQGRGRGGRGRSES